MSLKLPKVEKQKSTTMKIEILETVVEKLSLYCLAYEEVYGDKITPEELAPLLIGQFLDTDAKFRAWLKAQKAEGPEGAGKGKVSPAPGAEGE